MRTRPALCVSFAAAGVALWVGSASAQDAATAGALFDKGVTDMQAGRFDSGCPAIEESQRMDPHPGTLFTLAECQAKWGKVASAVAHYQDYVAVVPRLPTDQQARHRERVAMANAQLAKLKPIVPTLTLVLPASAPPGTTVTRNGVLLQGAALGLALPVDPGEYAIVTHLPSGEERSIKLKLALSEAKRVALELPATAPGPAAASTPAESPNAAPSAEKPAEGAPPTQASGSGRSRAPAYVAGGIGVAGVVLGSVTGILVLGKASTVKNDCNGTTCSSATGVNAADSGKSLAWVSDIGFGVGIVGLTTAAILLLSQPKAEPTARVAPARWEPLVAGTKGGAWAGLERRW